MTTLASNAPTGLNSSLPTSTLVPSCAAMCWYCVLTLRSPRCCPFFCGRAGKTPFGQLPLYEEPGLTLVQASAITRYLAKKHGFAGTNDREAALIDQAHEGANDILSRVVQIFPRPQTSRKRPSRRSS